MSYMSLAFMELQNAVDLRRVALQKSGAVTFSYSSLSKKECN